MELWGSPGGRVAEEIDGAGVQASGTAGGDGPAMALGLGAASRERADSFLQKQEALSDLQIEEMRAEEPYKRSHLRLRRFSGWAKAAFEFSIGLIALALVASLSVMVWNAAHADGLIVESFTVPPSLAEKGFSGEAIASRMLDKLTTIQRDSASVLPSRSYANSWGDDLKVDIPQTGVSVGEVYRFLRGWLGHEIRVNGEIVRTDSGIAVTARVGGANGATFSGPEAALDALLLQSAQHVYRATQPDRYARYLFINAGQGGLARYDEARSILTALLVNGTLLEKASAAHGLGVLDGAQGRIEAAIANYRQAIAWNPDSSITYSNLANNEYLAGHSEAALAMAQACVRIMNRNPVPNIIPREVPKPRLACQMRIAMMSGDFAAVPGLAQSWLDAAGGVVGPETVWNFAATAMAQQHEAAADAYLARLPAPATAGAARTRALTRLQLAAAREDWPAIIAQAPVLEESSLKAQNFVSAQIRTVARPWAAYAHAKTGDFAAADRTIAPTPGDCYPCLIVRAQIAELRGQRARAEYWFARAVATAPSIPFAYHDWGRALLGRKQPDAAIEKFRLSNQKGPKFADPLQGWGEALMAKNQSHLALAKFAEAEKFAPNWGRLHLKWGQALAYAGRAEEAKAKFARAAQLDLTPSEKSELASRNE